ncbi:MAG: hypothetical protein JWN13_7208, partial [Betaproteobacteria bacterium]|nr:hypothetical protein [Betaproteobacteria bacterium]
MRLCITSCIAVAMTLSSLAVPAQDSAANYPNKP